MNYAYSTSARVFFSMALGALVIAVAPALFDKFSAVDVPAMWWAGRATGLLAYLALWLSALFGVLVSGRGAGGLLDRAVALQLHTRWSVAALVATTLHVLLIVADRHSGVSPLAAIVPLASDKLRGPIALGTLALWGMATIGVTTALFKHLPRWLWRATHAAAFGTFVLALIHSVSAGSETTLSLVRGIYAGTTAIFVGAVIQRVLIAWHRARARPGR